MTISFRPIRLSDLEVLEQLHHEICPIRYESEFFINVVTGRGIVSWGAVDCSRPGNESDQLIGFVTAGFVTARIVVADGNEIWDMLTYEPAKTKQNLVYIMTLGVAEAYRNHGIASSLIMEVIKYASSIPSCTAVYLHVITYNYSAIRLYKKMSFQCIRRLADFYFIDDQYCDSYLFVYYVNGSRSPCSPLDIVATCSRSLCKLLASKLWKIEERIIRRPKCKENNSLLVSQNKRNLTDERVSIIGIPTAKEELKES